MIWAFGGIIDSFKHRVEMVGTIQQRTTGIRTGVYLIDYNSLALNAS
jgi:hypothetical protein